MRFTRSPAPAELSPEPALGVLEAVVRAVAHVAERWSALRPRPPSLITDANSLFAPSFLNGRRSLIGHQQPT